MLRLRFAFVFIGVHHNRSWLPSAGLEIYLTQINLKF